MLIFHEHISLGVSDSIVVIGAFDAATSQLIGYGIIEPLSGDVPQLAVLPSHRRCGIATAIFQQLLTRIVAAEVVNIKVISVEVGCTSLIEFLKSRNVHSTSNQYEMRLML